MKSHAGEALGALQQEKESQVKDREAYEGRVAGLMMEVDEPLQKNLKRVYQAFEQAADQVEALYRTYLFPAFNLNRSRSFRRGLGGGCSFNISKWSDLICF
ncbi:unnamed protein product [Vicia faba]|uniref:BAR domain-containing protein n=1 Tax=Vicia faba TaxID=3906 RepID=A0AAV1B427_VICFA|nr:unnamed protein product [Vicia faba]